MEKQLCNISPASINRLKVQGFKNFTDYELSEYRPGIRFAYQLCTTGVIIGLALQSIPVLSVMAAMAFGGTIHNRHPFDYIYNYGVRHLINKPGLPTRTIQGNIACGIATVMLTLIIYFFYIGAITGAYIAGAMLLSSAILVSMTDICIPSVIYDLIRKKN